MNKRSFDLDNGQYSAQVNFVIRVNLVINKLILFKDETRRTVTKDESKATGAV